MTAKLLIVDDEENVRTSLQDYFQREGYKVQIAADGPQALSILNGFDADLIILDVNLPPFEDGFEVCRLVRQEFGHSIGIIMISGTKKDFVDRVVGLEIGADDYIIKPFETRELLARVKAVQRRQVIHPTPGKSAEWLVIDEHLRINFDKRLVEAGGEEVHLTVKEFDLLKYLIERAGKPCGRSDIIDNIWEPEGGWDTYDAAINVCVARLRAKIEQDSSNPVYIQSVRGIGYRFKEF
jgi:DNA-binding response OmpR family regulator